MIFEYKGVKYSSLFVSVSSFVTFILGLYYLAEVDLFTATGFVVLILIHELGHVFALMQTGGTLKGVYFFPLVGAITVGANQLKREQDYAYFKYSGPLWGMVSVCITLLLYWLSHDERLEFLIYLGALINLANMVPITLLDGYGMLRGSVKHVEWVGFLIVAILGLYFHLYILTLYLLLMFTLFSESPWKKPTGFQWHELILAIGFIAGMMILTIREPESLVWNIPLIVLALYIFGAYLKVTCWDDQSEEKPTLPLLPLSKSEQVQWRIRWGVLTMVLTAVLVYSAGIVFWS